MPRAGGDGFLIGGTQRGFALAAGDKEDIAGVRYSCAITETRGVLMVRTISLWHVARQNAHWEESRIRSFPGQPVISDNLFGAQFNAGWPRADPHRSAQSPRPRLLPQLQAGKSQAALESSATASRSDRVSRSAWSAHHRSDIGNVLAISSLRARLTDAGPADGREGATGLWSAPEIQEKLVEQEDNTDLWRVFRSHCISAFFLTHSGAEGAQRVHSRALRS